MVARLKDKANHPFYNKNHSTEIKNLISKKAELNPRLVKVIFSKLKN